MLMEFVLAPLSIRTLTISKDPNSQAKSSGMFSVLRPTDALAPAPLEMKNLISSMFPSRIAFDRGVSFHGRSFVFISAPRLISKRSARTLPAAKTVQGSSTISVLVLKIKVEK